MKQKVKTNQVVLISLKTPIYLLTYFVFKIETEGFQQAPSNAFYQIIKNIDYLFSVFNLSLNITKV